MPRHRRCLVRWRVPHRTGAAARARTAVGAALADWGWGEDRVAAAVLVLSEMLTNAQVHTTGDVVLAVRRTGRGVRLSVTDTGSRMPTRRDTGPEHEGGFGLHILDTLTTDWGVRKHRGGKTVWADLDAPRPDARRHPRPVRAGPGAAPIRAALGSIRRAGPAVARRTAVPRRSAAWVRRQIGSSARGWVPAAIRRMRHESSRLMLVDVLAAV
ncbi:ATP-binding protein [Embleya sp. NPDC127516]|uniref:ATP-binding protein n=1 Tax=Embleya sp. NPDC127516 TaxID=3363990 RepID=UPI00380BABD6